ncbi:MAG: hypothetical protein QXT73_00755 [Candidatus Methanomethylicaceae archaeon]
MPSVVYNILKQKLMTGDVRLDGSGSQTFKVALVTSSYTPDIDNHTSWANITNEVSGAGYTSGGATLSGLTVFRDLTNDKGVFDANDVVWTNSTITARGAVIYRSDPSDPTQRWLVCYFDFTTDKSSSSGDFTIQWNANGILNLT